jgi:predicted nucleotidyltransferase
VVCQAREEFSLKEPSLAPYRALAQKLEAKFNTFEIEHAQRNENRYADALATLGSQITFEGEEMDVTICKKIEPITESLKKEFEELSQDQED